MLNKFNSMMMMFLEKVSEVINSNVELFRMAMDKKDDVAIEELRLRIKKVMDDDEISDDDKTMLKVIKLMCSYQEMLIN